MSIAAAVAVELGSEENVATLLERAAAARPSAPALIDPGGGPTRTIAEMRTDAAEIAGALMGHGVGPGSHVLVMLRNPVHVLAVVMGTIWAGAVAMIPPRTRGLGPMLRLAAAAAPDIVVADRLSAAVCAASPALRRVLVPWSSLGGYRPVPPTSVSSTSPALMTWTTGSTAAPSPVIRAHGVLLAQHEALVRLRGLGPDDIDLIGLPALALHDLAQGVGFIIAPRRRRWAGESARRLVRDGRVTSAAGFPQMVACLVDGAREGDLAGLRTIHVGGAPVPLELLERLARVAPRADVVVVYGMTEAEPIAAITAADYVRLTRSRTPGDGLPVGLPVDGIQLRVEPFVNGACGRVLVHGPSVAAVATRTDAHGWLDTGDAGRVDESGRLWLLGRTANVALGRYAPAEIEEPVAALQGVAAAALVSIDSAPGECQVLAIERAAAYSAATERDVRSLVKLHGWPVDRIAVLRRLPRDERSGTKVDYPRLRAMLVTRGGFQHDIG